MDNLPKVYLAGKIASRDWRHGIFTDLADFSTGCERGPERDGFRYCGPFFSQLGHGGDHGQNTHGSANDLGHADVYKRCIQWLTASDVVFCYLDGTNPFGTVFELGFAAAHDIPVYFAVESMFDVCGDTGIHETGSVWRDTWLAQQAATVAIRAPSAITAWSHFLTRWPAFSAGSTSSLRRRYFARTNKEKP